MSIFLKGFIIGVAVSAPIGPIGVLCIRRSLTQGFLIGLATGLGAAFADTFYSLMAGLGLTVVIHFLIQHQMWLKLGGGLILIFLGLHTLLSVPLTYMYVGKHKGFIATVLETFVLTLANPLTLFSFVALFAGLGLANTIPGYYQALQISLGIFIGSASWFFVLSSILGLCRSKFTPYALNMINKISGFLLLAFGTIALLSAFNMIPLDINLID